jgi:hypothetical protein
LTNSARADDDDGNVQQSVVAPKYGWLGSGEGEMRLVVVAECCGWWPGHNAGSWSILVIPVSNVCARPGEPMHGETKRKSYVGVPASVTTASRNRTLSVFSVSQWCHHLHVPSHLKYTATRLPAPFLGILRPFSRLLSLVSRARPTKLYILKLHRRSGNIWA